MRNRKSRIILLTAFAVCLVVLFSLIYVLAETGHECIGDSCPVCAQIHVCESVLRSVLAASAVCAAVGFAFPATADSRAGRAYRTGSCSLVSLNVKLSA